MTAPTRTEVRGRPDLAAATRELADDFLEAGYVEIPDVLRVLASVVDGDCPVHGREHPTVPIDGREVDRAPEIKHEPFTDDGVTYCGWGTGSGVVDGCGEVWPCSTVRARQIVRDEATRKALDNHEEK